MPNKKDEAINNTNQTVYLVDGARSPFLKAKSKIGAFAASDLAVATARALLKRQPFAPEAIEQVIAGCTMPSADEANIGRIISLRLGCGNGTTGWTVQRNCASGLQSIDNAFQEIRTGRANLILAGGVDVMSRAPLLLNLAMTNWMTQWFNSKTVGQKAGLLLKLRPQYFAPVIGLMRGLTDPVVGFNMGQTAENVAYRFGITRAEMDEFAARSHQRVLSGVAEGHYPEIVTLYDEKGRVYDKDDGVRADSTAENLTKLRPYFDKKYGMVTAGNSSQITDGAAFVILASEAAVKKYNLSVVAKINDVVWSGLDPKEMGLGPAHSIAELLARNNLGLNDIDFYEINEAFAAQVIACLRALASNDYCRNVLNLEKALGELDLNKLNVDGGAIALGHPIGASGSRLVIHLMQLLQRSEGRYGIASLCIGGGQGGAMLIEKVKGVQ